MRSNNSFLTLLVSFCLSTGSYILAQPDDVPVQHLEFDDYEIKGYIDVIEFDEHIVIVQKDESDDGDGENIDMMNENWCLIHPDDVICQDVDEEEEEQGC